MPPCLTQAYCKALNSLVLQRLKSEGILKYSQVEIAFIIYQNKELGGCPDWNEGKKFFSACDASKVLWHLKQKDDPLHSSGLSFPTSSDFY